MSVVLEEERKIDKRSLFVILFFVVVFVIVVFLAWRVSMMPSYPPQNLTEPIEPHMSPAIMAKSILGVK